MQGTQIGPEWGPWEQPGMARDEGGEAEPHSSCLFQVGKASGTQNSGGRRSGEFKGTLATVWIGGGE